MKVFALIAGLTITSAFAADDVDCVKNTASRVTCSITPDKTGTFRLKLISTFQAKTGEQGLVSGEIRFKGRRKACAEEKDVPISGQGAFEVICTTSLGRGSSYTVTATTTAQAAEARSIDLVVDRPGKGR